jgi:D-alanyl-D-alanine carboxypeptidase (penicillin-binding protein 5/6)
MTAYIVSTRGNLDDVVTISQEAANQPGSIMGARVNEKLTVRSLLLGALLVSGNDCAMALAEYGGGVLLNNPGAPREERIARFVAEMNSEAHKLNMEHTAYLDPAGLNDEGHSSALDLAKLAHFVLIQPVIKEMIPLANTTVTNVSGTIRHDLRNSNRLVADYNYVGIIGGKTGFTPSAGHCLITAAERDGLQLIAVVLNTYAETKEASAQEARKMLDWGFANWKLQ